MPLAFFDDNQKKLSERILTSSEQEMPELPSTGETLSGEELEALIRSLVGQESPYPEKDRLSSP